MKAYIQLGKAGDIISILPCLLADFIEDGEKPHLIVSSRYAHVLQGVEYVEPIIYAADWQDLSGAILDAKRRYPNISVPQMHAKDYMPRRMYPSFQLDQWARCGRLNQWGQIPLEYPRSESVKGKYILLGDHSESSKFAHIEDLHLSLVAEFPHHRIVRLSSTNLPQLADVLALYDGADLIVTIDTMHAHLSAASRTPVIVLATDTPSRWHGSAYHPRMVAHIRYGDYTMKKEQLLHAARVAVNKVSTPWVVKEQTAQQYGYNMSVLQVGDNLWKTYRYHPGKSWRTDLALKVESSEVTIRPPAKYAHHSFEDGRLFMFGGKPHISLTIARSRAPGQPADPCIQGFGQLQPDGQIVNWVEPKIGKNDWSSQEKNWVYFEFNRRLHVIYSLSPAQIVYELDAAGKSVREYKTPVPACSFGDLRGGTQPLEYRGQWLRFVHANQTNRKSDNYWNYALGAVLMESAPPFRVTAISRNPVLVGNELFSEAPHWKPRCILPYGALRNGDGFEVAVGLNDCECATVFLQPENLNL